jgi:hypothetical protein
MCIRYHQLKISLIVYDSYVGYYSAFKIQRNNGTSHARLVQLLTEGTVSPNPRWLIRSISNSKDEEVYEHSFIGKVSEKNRDDVASHSDEHNATDDLRPNQSPVLSDPPDETTMSETSRISKKKKTAHNSSENANGIDSTINSDSSVVRKAATNRNKSSSTSTTSKASTKHAMSASSREARSRRRGQSIPDKDLNVQQEQYDGVGSTESLIQPDTSVRNVNVNQKRQKLQQVQPYRRILVTTITTKRKKRNVLRLNS